MRARCSTWNTPPRTSARRLRAVALGTLLALAAAIAHAPVTAQEAPSGGAKAAPDAAAETARFLWSRYGAGNYTDAAEAARAVLEEDPRDFDATDVLAGALESTGEGARAEEELRKLITETGAGTAATPGAVTSVAALVRLAEHLVAEERPEEALAPLAAALAGATAAPANPGAIQARGLASLAIRARAVEAVALAALARRDEAAASLRALFRAYQAVPDEAISARAWIGLARAALAAERVPALAKEHVRPFAVEARNFFQKAYDRDKDQADTLTAWARVYLEKFDLVEAKRLAKEALKRNPRHAGAHALQADLLLSDFYGGTGRYDEARREIEAALATDAGCAEAHALSAELLVTDGLLDEAARAAERALARRPAYARALAVRAGVLLLKGDATAIDATLTGLVPRGTFASAQFLAEVSGFFDGRFQYKRAYDLARRAVEMDPACLAARRQLGFAAMRTGDEAAARIHLDAVHDADPFDLFTYNQVRLLDYLEKEFTTDRSERFVLRVHKSEALTMRPYVKELLDRSWDELTARYGVALDTPILFEVFPDLNDFSVRAVAHRFIPASGVTFARVVALASPAAFPRGTHGWGRVLWHELAHVATLERSGYRVPRWLTEGLSVFEESKGHPSWTREWDVDIVDALARDRLLPISELNLGFSKPRFPNQVMLSYYQGGLICRFIEKTWGFPALLALLDGYKEGLSLEANLARALSGVTPAEFDRRFLADVRAEFATIPYRAHCNSETDLARLRKAARERPKDADAQALYALGAADMRRTADAEAALGKLMALAPSSGDVPLVRALIAIQRNDAANAVPLLADARALGTRDPMLAEGLLFQHYAAKDPKTKEVRDLRKALTSLESLHALFPRNPAPLHSMRELAKEAGLKDRLLSATRALADIEPDNIDARAELVAAARERGDLVEAAGRLEEMLWLDPRAPGLHLEYAEALVAQGRFTLAKREILLYRALAPNADDAAPVLEALVKAGALDPSQASPQPPTGTPTPAPTPAPAPAPAPKKSEDF